MNKTSNLLTFILIVIILTVVGIVTYYGYSYFRNLKINRDALEEIEQFDRNHSIVIFGTIISDQRYFMLPINAAVSVYAISGLVLLFVSLRNARQFKIKLMLVYIFSTVLPLAVMIANIFHPEYLIIQRPDSINRCFSFLATGNSSDTTAADRYYAFGQTRYNE